MTLAWKAYKDTESVFWEAFKKEGPEEVIFKLANEKGWLKTDVSVVHGGYEYKGKSVEKKDGSGYWHFVERKSMLGEDSEEQKAAQKTVEEQQQRQQQQKPSADYWKQKDENIAKAHQENLQRLDRQNTLLERIAVALEKLASNKGVGQ